MGECGNEVSWENGDARCFLSLFFFFFFFLFSSFARRHQEGQEESCPEPRDQGWNICGEGSFGKTQERWDRKQAEEAVLFLLNKGEQKKRVFFFVFLTFFFFFFFLSTAPPPTAVCKLCKKEFINVEKDRIQLQAHCDAKHPKNTYEECFWRVDTCERLNN